MVSTLMSVTTSITATVSKIGFRRFHPPTIAASTSVISTRELRLHRLIADVDGASLLRSATCYSAQVHIPACPITFVPSPQKQYSHKDVVRSSDLNAQPNQPVEITITARGKTVTAKNP